MLEKFVNINWKIHLALGFTLRLLFIVYGIYQDQNSTVPYTDIDYKVFTDAARHIYNGGSPYQRHTYRYTPLVALILLPNIFLFVEFGKLLFSLFDLIDGILIKLIVSKAIKDYLVKKEKKIDKVNKINEYFTSNLSLVFWLYNPLILTVTTRGNCDSIAVFFVLFTLYLLQNSSKYLMAGFVHGLSVHFRVYPLIFSLTYFMYLSKFSSYNIKNRKLELLENIPKNKQIENVYNSNNKIQLIEKKLQKKKTIFQKHYLLYLVPNYDQIKFIFGCLISMVLINSLFYYLYRWDFLYNTFLYHFIRVDYRHNFSLYFYLQYLTAWIKNIGIWQKILMNLPKIVLLLVFSIRYGLNRFTLNFAVLTQTIVFVIYNTVITSQYFVWIIAILALCLWQIKMKMKKALFFLGVWFAAQGAWLLPAYLLEFHGQNTFFFIWIQSVSFFCANIAILGRLIMYFTP